MSYGSDLLQTKLATVRVEAWDMLPLWRRLLTRAVWRRMDYKPLWNLSIVDKKPRELPPFNIIGGMCIYSIADDIAAAAPRPVLVAIYGCLFVHTGRFWWRSGDTIYKNGHGDVHLLQSWPKSVRIAQRYHFATEHMQRWLAAFDSPLDDQTDS